MWNWLINSKIIKPLNGIIEALGNQRLQPQYLHVTCQHSSYNVMQNKSFLKPRLYNSAVCCSCKESVCRVNTVPLKSSGIGSLHESMWNCICWHTGYLCCLKFLMLFWLNLFVPMMYSSMCFSVGMGWSWSQTEFYFHKKWHHKLLPT